MTITVNIFDSNATRPTGENPITDSMPLEGGASIELARLSAPMTGTPDTVASMLGGGINAGSPSADLVQMVEASLALARAIVSEGTQSVAGISAGAPPLNG
jgi:hypothetical protein